MCSAIMNLNDNTKMIPLDGKTIQLRPMTADDLEYKVRWFNDPEVNSTLIFDDTLDLDKTVEWFEIASKDPTRRDFVIETHDSESIGLIGLVGIDDSNATAEIYIVIGQKDYWGKGVMAEAESILIQWAFDELSLQKIWALARPENVASIITMKKLGFQIEGTLRKEKIIAGKRIDIIRVGVLPSEFRPTGMMGAD